MKRFDSIAYKLYKLKALIGPEQSGLFHWCVAISTGETSNRNAEARYGILA